jgi:hypothetical protein
VAYTYFEDESGRRKVMHRLTRDEADRGEHRQLSVGAIRAKCELLHRESTPDMSFVDIILMEDDMSITGWPPPSDPDASAPAPGLAPGDGAHLIT